MELETLFVIGMFLTFGALLMTGYPVAWVLGGTAVIWTLIGVVAVVMLIAFAFFLASNVVAKRLSPTVATVVSRLLGMILAALAVQFIIDGVKQAFFQ